MSVIPSKDVQGIIVDLFAGGGGASVGIEAGSGRHVDVALNHDPIALAVHKSNHPGTYHLEADIWKARAKEVCGGRPVDLLWASPDCTHFSNAKGGKPCDKKIRSLAWAVARWAKEVRPKLIIIENVREFQGWGPLDHKGKPIITRMGETFRRWRRYLEQLGYIVDLRILDASLYGAPTKRRRLFLVARCDMQPIRWPEPTHGPGKLPLHTAAECIDWNIPCPSIFLDHAAGRAAGVKRPLAPATLRRVAAGIERFVLNGKPYIVEMRNNCDVRSVDEPLSTITAGGQKGGKHHALVTPFVTTWDQQGSGDHVSKSIEDPLTTITAKARHALVAPVLVNTRNGERHGRHGEQAARVFDLREPMRTITAQGSQGAVVAAYLARHNNAGNGGFAGGTSLDDPMPTLLTKIGKSALVTATLDTSELEGARRVAAFLSVYNSKGGDPNSAAGLHGPLPTITTVDRLALVTVQGYPVVDIGMRILKRHELARGQFGRFAESYDLSAAESDKDAVRLIGNSVCPEVAEAVVRANLTPDMDLYGQGDLFTGLKRAA